MQRCLNVLSKLILTTVVASGCARIDEPHAPAPNISADQAMRRLMDGNTRFVKELSLHPNLDVEHRMQLKAGQRPFAIILGCSDSRVPPDLVFDTGLGDLFVVRVAGNVTDDVVIGSIEYAVDHLGTNLILVLGHEKCGAVAAALEAATVDAHVPGHIHSLVEAIEPALRDMSSTSRDKLDDAVRANVKYVVERLRHAQPIISKAVKSGNLKVMGAYYDLETGRVEIIDPDS